MASDGSERLTIMRSSLTKQSSSGVHVFELAFEHIDDILNIAFRLVWYLHTHPLWQSPVCVVAYNGQSVFWVDFIKPPATIADIDRFYKNWWFVCSQVFRCWCIILWKSDFVCHSYENMFRIYFFPDTVYIDRRHFAQLVAAIFGVVAGPDFAFWCTTKVCNKSLIWHEPSCVSF